MGVYIEISLPSGVYDADRTLIELGNLGVDFGPVEQMEMLNKGRGERTGLIYLKCILRTAHSTRTED